MARVSQSQRLTTALTWPVGIASTSWAYLWRTTPVHRHEAPGTAPDNQAPEVGTRDPEVQGPEGAVGPLFHRRYRARIRQSRLAADQLIARIARDPNVVAPTTFARFVKTQGAPEGMAIGDEYVVRMPGPWDGPVRVVDRNQTSFRLATLDGHLEAGQIEFRASDGEANAVEFTIESWARSGDRFANLLFARVGVAKEVQLHLWITVLERIVGLSGGQLAGGIEVRTRRVDALVGCNDPPRGTPRIRRKLAALREARPNFESVPATHLDLPRGWRHDRLTQDLPPEAPGPPVTNGSFAIARRLMQSYQFADPSIVRAFYDEAEPLERRTMLLEVRFHRLRFHIGVRVHDVYEWEIEHEGRPVLVWGWGYGTLRGHFEMGQMEWQLWKFLDTGEVQFRIDAVSRRAPLTNPVIRLGFRLFGRRQQLAFLHSTLRRMSILTSLGLDPNCTREDVRAASAALTARDADTAAADAEVAGKLAG